MTTASSTRALRAAPPRSLPTITVFSHPASRLIKTVPQLHPPPRVNGHVARDTLGLGRVSSSDVVLTDVAGPLSILVVPDPLDPTIATLVLSVAFQDPLLQGAARRFVLPFRSFQRDPVSGLLISQSKINGFDAALRILYPGLGAGLKGLDGGSFWFFEDVSEQGALDRYRWERDRVGRRAVWTVWLFSTPAPVVLHVQNLLRSYPASVPPLPPWLDANNGFPWKDSYSVMPASTSPPAPQQQSVSPVSVDRAVKPSVTSSFPLLHRPLPANPSTSAMPGHRHSDEPELLRKAPESVTVDICADTPLLAPSAPVNHPTGIGSQGGSLGGDVTHASSRRSGRSIRLDQGSSSHELEETAEVSRRESTRTAGMPEYRNSLVAVDNLTGQIIGIVASHVSLNGSPEDPTQLQAPSPTNSYDADADVEDEDEAKTPIDEPTRILRDKTTENALFLRTEPTSGPAGVDLSDGCQDEEQLIAPRQSIFAHPAAHLYRGASFDHAASRPPSVLAADTFAPPPVPPKQAALHDACKVRQKDFDKDISRRSSSASAAFFSAASDDGVMASYDPDPLDVDLATISHHDSSARFISLCGKMAIDIERHRPELLQDAISAQDPDDDAATDASGSTIGGPAVRLWRKAKGKTKKKKDSDKSPATQSTPAQPRLEHKSRQASETSDRTSNAVTAFEAFSDDETASAAIAEPQFVLDADFPAHSDRPTDSGDSSAPVQGSPRGPGHHLPRSALRTDQVRSIEDRVWCEAFDDGHLPIDAPYTHLSAHGESSFYSSSILSSTRSFADGSAFELLSAEDKARQAEKKKKKQQQQKQQAERMKYMQGGTVLIEFLAGSSRIGASLIRSAGFDAGGGDADFAARPPEVGVASKSSDLTSDFFDYVPLLPQHLLAFLGLTSSPGQLTSKTDAGASSLAPSASTWYHSYFPSFSLPAILSDATDWVTKLFTFSSTSSPTTITSADMDTLTSSKAEAWEYAIPDFDPSSLDQTARPVYRRRRPVPSAKNGFNVFMSRSDPNSTAQETTSDGPDLKPSVPLPRATAASEHRNEQRYSILHIDSLGIGRHAFLRGDRSNICGLRP